MSYATVYEVCKYCAKKHDPLVNGTFNLLLQNERRRRAWRAQKGEMWLHWCTHRDAYHGLYLITTTQIDTESRA